METASPRAGPTPLLVRPGLFLELFFRPGRCFAGLARCPPLLLMVFCAWSTGLSGAIGTIKIWFPGGSPPPLAGSWPKFLALVAVLGALQGLFHFWIGGWWYRKRLEWSGVERPEPPLARAVYLLAAQVESLPAIAAEILKAFLHPTPLAALRSHHRWWDLALMGFFVGSFWTSYAGARAAFQARRSRAVLWFLVVPAAFYTLLILLLAAGVGLLASPHSSPRALLRP